MQAIRNRVYKVLLQYTVRWGLLFCLAADEGSSLLLVTRHSLVLSCSLVRPVSRQSRSVVVAGRRLQFSSGSWRNKEAQPCDTRNCNLLVDRDYTSGTHETTQYQI